MINIPWTFDRDDYLVKKICSDPDYWCSNEGEFWYVNRAQGVEIQLEVKGAHISQYFEKTRKKWHVKTLLDSLFGIGNHIHSTKKEVETGVSSEKAKKPKHRIRAWRQKTYPICDV